MKMAFTLIIGLASLSAVATPLTKNSISCIARKTSQGQLIAAAYGFGSVNLSTNVENSLGAFYNSQKRTGYCQSMKYIGGNFVEYTTTKILGSESPVEYESPCKFIGDRIHLSIDKKVVTLEEGYSYPFKNGEHEFGSGDILKIEFLTDLPYDTAQDREVISAECLKILNR